MNSFLELMIRCAQKLHAYELCTALGIEGLAYRIFCRDLVRKSKRYFEENRARIKKNCALLSDEESVSIYIDAIKYRIKRYRHDHPQFTLDQYFPKGIINLSPTEVLLIAGHIPVIPWTLF